MSTRIIPTISQVKSHKLEDLGMNHKLILDAVHYTHKMLDTIDVNLIAAQSGRLSSLVELANLSSIIGNFFRAGIVMNCNGLFLPNTPHTFPDLLANSKNCKSTEIKVALETNNPKGHLVKPGPHLIVRYVLGSLDGSYIPGKENRGDVVWIWEVRAGILLEEHFNVSNTDGDSGKTAVINAAGMNSLDVVYLDTTKLPRKPRGAKKIKV